MNIRRAALVAFVASVLGMIGPIWRSINRILGLGVTGTHWWLLPSMVLGLCFTAIMPVFYFALYRDQGTMRLPRALRKLALAAAVTYGIVTVVALQAVAHLTWVSALGLVPNASYIFLLLTMSRDVSEEPTGTAPSDLLVGITKLAVIVWGVWVAFQFVRIPIVMLTYGQLERFAYGWNRTPPSVRDMVMEVVLTFFSQAGLLTAPYIVWRSRVGRGVPETSVQL